MSALTPLSRFERLDDMFPELFRRFVQPMSTLSLEPMGEIRLDIDETEKAYTVRAEIPGAKKDDIRVEIDGNRVAISAEVRKQREEKEAGDKGRVLVRETYRGSASRTFTLAHDVDEANAAAKLEDGVLTLTLPKRAGSRNRLVAIE
jgi:HSP20 family protein